MGIDFIYPEFEVIRNEESLVVLPSNVATVMPDESAATVMPDGASGWRYLLEEAPC